MNRDNFEVLGTKFSGVWLTKNKVHQDQRGTTSEILNIPALTIDGSKFDVSQILECRSRRNVIRGIHYSDVSNPQVKVVRCIDGKIRDCVIDLRAGSATFGQYEVFELSSEANQNLIISSGFGHAYEVITESATVLYAIETNFRFDLEYSINPLDLELALPWESSSPILSEKDSAAKSFAFAAREILGDTPH